MDHVCPRCGEVCDCVPSEDSINDCQHDCDDDDIYDDTIDDDVANDDGR